LTFSLKKNELINLRSLLDIVVVDLLNISKNGRFLLNYVFLNYIKEVRVIIKILNDGRQPIRSLARLYKSSD
jgi:NADH:ubiquinone oxidoreductase subunit C